MKKIIYSLFIVVLFSCSSENKYEKLIGDYVQTDKSGKWTDLQFKAIEIKELEPITVSDSVGILKDKFEKNIADLVGRQDASIERSQGIIDRQENASIKMQSIIDMYSELIKAAEHHKDSLNNIKFTSIYDNEKQDKILIIPVECQYSIVLSPYPLQKMTEIFYYSPEEDKIVSKGRKK